jgi:hypothetical protein
MRAKAESRKHKAKSIRLRKEKHEEHCFRLHFITPGQAAGTSRRDKKVSNFEF